MKISTPVFLVLFQLFFILLYIGETLLGLTSIHIFSTPIMIVIVIAISLILFVRLWRMNVIEMNRQISFTESTLEREFQLLVSTVKSDRHDLNNHLTVIVGLIQLGKFDQASRYIHNLIGEIQINNKILLINNPILASVILANLNRFQGANIKLEFNIRSEKITELISITDFVRLLTNLLDNAYEEVAGMIEPQRVVSLDIFETNSGAALTISNSTTKEQFDTKLIELKQTTKGNRADRGYGLFIIREIVNKYNGMIEIGVHNHTFKVEIFILKEEIY